MNNDAFVKNVASRLIEQIRNGTAPWQKPWRPGTSFLPFNPTNGTRYKGINVINLLARGHSDARRMTYWFQDGYYLRQERLSGISTMTCAARRQGPTFPWIPGHSARRLDR
jgi:antirestriction protein ArdC